MEIEVEVSGIGLIVTESYPESVTIGGSFEGLTFTNPYTTPTYFVIGVNKDYIKFITFEGSNLKVEKKDDKSVIIRGEVKMFRYRTEKGYPFKSYVIIPCDITVAEIEYR